MDSAGRDGSPDDDEAGCRGRAGNPRRGRGRRAVEAPKHRKRAPRPWVGYVLPRSVSALAEGAGIVDADETSSRRWNVRGRVARSAVALGSAGLVVLSMA